MSGTYKVDSVPLLRLECSLDTVCTAVSEEPHQRPRWKQGGPEGGSVEDDDLLVADQPCVRLEKKEEVVDIDYQLRLQSAPFTQASFLWPPCIFSVSTSFHHRVTRSYLAISSSGVSSSHFLGL